MKRRTITSIADNADTTNKTDLKLLQGTLDVFVLRALEHGDLHGYAVAEWIRQQSGEEFRIDDGALYTCLHRLEKQGWLSARWGVSERGRRAKFYKLTVKGIRHSSAETSRMMRYARALTKVLAGPAPEHT